MDLPSGPSSEEKEKKRNPSGRVTESGFEASPINGGGTNYATVNEKELRRSGPLYLRERERPVWSSIRVVWWPTAGIESHGYVEKKLTQNGNLVFVFLGSFCIPRSSCAFLAIPGVGRGRTRKVRIFELTLKNMPTDFDGDAGYKVEAFLMEENSSSVAWNETNVKTRMVPLPLNRVYTPTQVGTYAVALQRLPIGIKKRQ